MIRTIQAPKPDSQLQSINGGFLKSGVPFWGLGFRVQGLGGLPIIEILTFRVYTGVPLFRETTKHISVFHFFGVLVRTASRSQEFLAWHM